MPNTYSQLHIQFVFAVQKRKALIHDRWRDSLHQYITGIIQNNGHKVLQVNSMPDHLHLLAGMRPLESCSDLMKKVKGGSSYWINENNFCEEEFSWQSGFGAFSYCKSHVPELIRYIQNQQTHHKTESFTDEYKRLLDEFDIVYDERYIFHEPN